MRSTQVTTWRRYTAAEKKAYRLRELKRRQRRALLKDRVFADLYSGRMPDEDAVRALGWASVFASLKSFARPHHFADNLGSRVPTMRVNGDVL